MGTNPDNPRKCRYLLKNGDCLERLTIYHYDPDNPDRQLEHGYTKCPFLKAKEDCNR